MHKDKLLRYVIPAQKKFSKMYKDQELGLVAIASEYVQVTEYKFKNILDQFPGKLNYVSRKLNNDDFHLEMVVGGVVFVTVGTRKELEKAGLTP